jgi:hypothetical protein
LNLLDLTGQNSTFSLGFVSASAAGRVQTTVEPVCGNHVCEVGPPDAQFPAGVHEAAPNCPDDCVYDGMNDLDWWYVRDPASVDANETPLVQLAGQISGGHLTAGPGTISLNLLFAEQPSTVTLYDTRVDAQINGPVTAPTLSTTGTTPGHLPSEHLSPTLTSFSSSTIGSMCSNVSTASLFNTPIPPLLYVTCNDPTGMLSIYPPTATLLDVFLTGCNAFGTIPVIVPMQPDGSLDGATYEITPDPVTFAATSCTRNGAPANLADCVSQSTYSSYFKYNTDRVIIKRN